MYVYVNTLINKHGGWQTSANQINRQSIYKYTIYTLIINKLDFKYSIVLCVVDSMVDVVLINIYVHIISLSEHERV